MNNYVPRYIRRRDMNENFLLSNESAKRLYDKVKDLPIYDYHCHLNPEEIYKDELCSDIGYLWLSGDHYKWRMMRAAGVDEEYVTGKASYRDKFVKYGESSAYAAGSPLFHWNTMELDKYFGISDFLTGDNAEDIYERANKAIADKRLSPVKLIKDSGVRFIATTDDIADSLEWHEKIAADSSFDVCVTPSFRCDKLLLILADGYLDYVKRLSGVCGFEIDGIDSLCKAIDIRLDYFIERGCIFTDLGIPDFPHRIGSREEADKAFRAVLAGNAPDRDSYLAFLGYMMVYLGRLYYKKGRVMQLHLAVMRNANARLSAACGADCGSDCIGEVIPQRHIIDLFNAISRDGEMPRTIVYTLNPAMTDSLISLVGSFRNVSFGAAWWFNDHKRGIADVIKSVADIGYLGSFTGMLTDSRSFLSYARHDYFRRILCSVIGEWVEAGEYPEDLAEKLVERICCTNIKQIIEKVQGK